MAPPPQIKALERHFLDRLDAFVLAVEEYELTPEKRAERRTRCDASDLEFALEYFPDIFALGWNGVHRWIAGLPAGKWHCDGFRYSGKTAMGYIKCIIHPLALGVDGVVNLNTLKYEVGAEISDAIIRIMKYNRKLVYDYQITFDQEKAGYHIVNGTPFVVGSFRTGLRSIHDDRMKRITYQLNDDLYGVEEASSETLCDKIVAFVEDEAWGQLEQLLPALSLTLGNAINERSPIVRLKEKRPESHFTFPALANAQGEPDEAGESTWPEYRTTEAWHQFARETAWDVWAGQYMCKPAMKGENFKPEYIRYVSINTLKIIASISACDPAFGMSPEACWKAVSTVGATNHREAVQLDSFIRKCRYSELFDYVDALRGRMPFWKVLLFENDFSQWEFAAPYYDQWCTLRKATLPIVRYSSKSLKTAERSSDKDSRILNLVHPHVTGQFMYDERLKGSPDHERDLQQLFSHGRAKGKLDGPDSKATAYIMIWRWIDTGSFQPQKERVWTRPFGGLFRR